jgi:hypothetical protein
VLEGNLQTDKRVDPIVAKRPPQTRELLSAPPNNLQAQVAKLSGLGSARRTHHQIFSAVILWKSDDVTNVVGPHHEHDEAVDAQGDATVRRRAKSEGLEKVWEEQSLLIGRNAKHLEHPRLQVAFMNPDAAATDFDAIEDNIIGLGPDFAQLSSFQQWDVFTPRTGEGMMHRIPFLFLGAVSQKRKVHHPYKFESIRIFVEA